MTQCWWHWCRKLALGSFVVVSTLVTTAHLQAEAIANKIPGTQVNGSTLVPCIGSTCTIMGRTLDATGKNRLYLAAVQRSCTSPASLNGRRENAALGYIVVFKDGTNALGVTHSLARKYGFTPRAIYQYGQQRFSVGPLPFETLTALQCEPEVASIHYGAELRFGDDLK
jgi:hypothetical protein